MARAAGSVRESDFAGLDRSKVEVLSHPTADGVVLRGYRLRPSYDNPKGLVLVVQGNGHRAASLLQGIATFATAGYEVWILDFRGYGTSDDAPRSLHAIVGDYRGIIARFLREPAESKYVYGISFGAIVAMNALAGTESIKRLILDSLPDKVSGYGCPEHYDPSVRADSLSFPVMLIISGRDAVVPRDDQRILIGTATRKRNWKLLELANEHHPFTEGVVQLGRVDAIVQQGLRP